MSDEIIGASFRDPSGFVFRRDGVIHRQVNRSFAPDWEHFLSSGLRDRLVEAALLLPWEDVTHATPCDDPERYRTLRPEPLDFVSYPYEWCFGQLKDAALLTLRLQREALASGMSLRDASAFNVQHHRGRPVLIDSLSFEVYREGRPWVAYGQFCRHFLAPLALMARRDVRLLQLLRVHLDGIPLDLATRLLPWRCRLSSGLFMHLYLHARYQVRHAATSGEASAPQSSLPRRGLENIVRDLEAAVQRLEWDPEGTEWAEYASGDSYSEAYAGHKRSLVAKLLARAAPQSIWDLGANTGEYSRLAAERPGVRVVSFDGDPACVERSYRAGRAAGDAQVLPLLVDLTNPSAAQGFAHRERMSLLERAAPDAVLALALVHHLALSNNVPLARLADFFAGLAPWLVVEFVPKGDPKVEVLLASREDVFPGYTREGFEGAFAARFETLESAAIDGSQRRLYLMRRNREEGEA